MATALYIGRFQPLHNGHLAYIKKIAAENNKLIIAIGSAQEKNTKKNPFSFAQRKEMLQLCLKDEKLGKITIIPAKDYPDNNAKWLSRLKKKAGHFDTVYAGENQLIKKIFIDAGYKVKTVKRINKISSTEIRKLMGEKKDWKHLVPKTIYEYINQKI